MPVSDYTPDLSEVGAIMRARTRNDMGQEIGTFDASTSPTGAEATVLIARAVQDVSNKIGEDVPADLLDETKSVAAYRAAMLIELSHFSEQVGSDRSPYPQYKDLFEEELKTLAESIGEGGTSDERQQGPMPVFAFPEDDGGLIGWETRF